MYKRHVHAKSSKALKPHTLIVQANELNVLRLLLAVAVHTVVVEWQ